jgi:hypothetical protein
MDRMNMTFGRLKRQAEETTLLTDCLTDIGMQRRGRLQPAAGNGQLLAALPLPAPGDSFNDILLQDTTLYPKIGKPSVTDVPLLCILPIGVPHGGGRRQRPADWWRSR